MRLCEFDGCERPHTCNGLCSGHNMQRSQGRELTPLRVAEYKTFEDMLVKCEYDGDCIVWIGSKDKLGYGRMGFRRGRNVLAHRVSYILATGEDIEGAQIHHTCARRDCVNPEHLQRASAADNVLEMLARRDYEAEIARLQLRIVELEAQLEREYA